MLLCFFLRAEESKKNLSGDRKKMNKEVTKEKKGLEFND
jgi:hypothetical protein